MIYREESKIEQLKILRVLVFRILMLNGISDQKN